MISLLLGLSRWLCFHLGRFILVFSLLALVSCQPNSDAISSTGQAIYLKDFREKWVLVNYWAEWCHACMQELPDLVSLQEKYGDLLVVLGVNFDGRSDSYLNDFIKVNAINFVMTSHLPPQSLGVEPLATVPTTIVISPGGKVSSIVRQPRSLAQWEMLLSLK